MISGQNKMNESVLCKLLISKMFLSSRTVLCVSLTLILTCSPNDYDVRVSVCLCVTDWIMARWLCGMKGRLAKLKNGRLKEVGGQGKSRKTVDLLMKWKISSSNLMTSLPLTLVMNAPCTVAETAHLSICSIWHFHKKSTHGSAGWSAALSTLIIINCFVIS